MSKRNTQEAKRAARERLRTEREKQAKREKARRQVIVGATAVGVLAVAGVAGYAIANMGGGGDGTDWGIVAKQFAGEELAEDETAYPDQAPANTTGEDGMTIRIGPEDAAATLTVYEDPRCPICQQFEDAVGEELDEGLRNGEFAAEFVLASFLDANLDGTGSRNAVSALGAALDVSPEAFLAYKAELYSEDNHPAEIDDKFASDEYLIEIAQDVPELKDNQEFEDNVMDSTFALWALRMGDTFAQDGEVTGTPAVRLNGELVNTPQSPEQLDALVASASQ